MPQSAFLPFPSGLWPPRAPRRLRAAPRACAEMDARYMRRAVQLARLAEGQTRPNPPVGCVLTSAAGELLAEGYHRRAGFSHAEANALQDAARRAIDVRGATAYVSLEPCNHHGRTPPCSRALLAAGVSRVVVGMVDPDPRTAGRGVQTLRDGGVEVVVGTEGELCERLNEGFVHRVVHGRPMGVLKFAMTLDGKINACDGSSKWVTGPEARVRVQSFRRAVDAIVVGGQTVRADDPRLTVRDGVGMDSDGVESGGVDCDGRPLLSPLRVVMSRSLDLPQNARLWDNVHQFPTAVLVDAAHGKPALVKDLLARGVKVEQVAGLTTQDTIDYLHHYGCLKVMWECGGNLASQAIREGAVQKVHAFIAPKMVGGTTASTPLGDPPVASAMRDALLLENRSIDNFENGDVLISGYLKQRA